MYKGGSIYTPRSVQIFRYVGLFIPIVLVSYGALIQFNVIRIPHSIDNLGLLTLSFWWLYISILQFLFPSQKAIDSILRLIAYHLLAGAYLIFVSGIASPFIACWLLLMIASYIYFSNIGLLFSALTLVVVVAIDIIMWHTISLYIAVYDLTALAAILITGFVLFAVNSSQEVSKNELTASKAQESLQRDRVLTIVNNMADAVFSTDVNGVIKVYNAASMSLLDTNDSLNGHNINEVLPLSDKDNNKISILDELMAARTVVKRDDLNFTYDDGEQIRLEITYSPIRSSFSRSKKSEKHDGYIVIMRDVTKSKSLEEERDEFISVVSHELRTPIAIAEGTISNVQVMMDHPNVTNDMLKDAVNVAHDQIIFLANMVNDLSTLSRAERGVAGDAEDIDVRKLAYMLHDKYAESAKEKKLHLNLDLQSKIGSVRVSRLYLEELLQNFITNSIKYTKKGGVTIIAKQSDGMITIAVKDTGIGISKSDQTKIFQKFYRSEDYRTRETSGTGLGLYIAAKLAHKLGIKINFTSRLNFGSTFSITLPESKN
ncbi:hypothetical protein AUK57_00945 [Candidatus Saccharibacteria bacterium CG2_30_41_52]|nr:MAG: hypothetical protein AUK57_00945 [Candidatus Saccharibacteria bacterium CG2_30_41_52]